MDTKKHLSGPSVFGPGATGSAPTRHANRRRRREGSQISQIFSKKCETKDWDKVEQFQVVDFGRLDMTRWPMSQTTGVGNAAVVRKSPVRERIRSAQGHKNRAGAAVVAGADTTRS
jgi:hypothetical protein